MYNRSVLGLYRTPLLEVPMPRVTRSPSRKVWLLCLLAALLLAAHTSVAAPHYKILHRFRNSPDGALPYAGLTMDAHGTLYGTTQSLNTVFRLSLQKDGSWKESILFDFPDPPVSGEAPLDDVTLKDGNVYLTAQGGGGIYGVVLELTPSVSGLWNVNVLHTFAAPPPPDGVQPWAGVVFDQAGNLYGDTIQGWDQYADGVVFQLVPSDGGRTENILYGFTGKKSKDGWSPAGDLIVDKSGNLYGTTMYGGVGCGLYGCGTVFELSQKDGVWTEKIIYRFKGGADGVQPFAGLTLDDAGNLYGTTSLGGIGPCDISGTLGCGTVFKLTRLPSGNWKKTILYSPDGSTGGGLFGGVVFDKSGNLYGPMTFYGKTDQDCGAGCGSVFKLTPGKSGKWTATVLHQFSGTDGGEPFGHVLIDKAGNVFGTTYYGGYSGEYCTPFGCGLVFEIMP